MRPIIECDGITGIGTEYRDSPEKEVIYSTWREDHCGMEVKKKPELQG